ncbi:exodeoxyribonuclease VII large subunit [Propionivibrio sp.]|uniref:exodeoxyribonuclease VII large subunit n=1 Tax=Propionivibrio sp. TaxID=2212460 RepID=UPI003BF29C1C
MAQTYLTVDFKEKDKVKSLGARWDSVAKKWYAPDGLDLVAFKAWLPAGISGGVPKQSASPELAPITPSTTKEVALQSKGISLSQLLGGVSQAVAQAFNSGVWPLVEVVQARTNGGHVYLEVSERDANGSVLAKANATIWATTANKILPQFEKATGASIAPGIKLLVRARPVYKPQYGFSLDVDAIDPDYTLGDLEARKREIRIRLQQEGIFDANKKLPAPWDYTAILVIAPQGAAGLGDFQAEAKRLEQFGICRFVYAASRFQGEGAAAEILDAILSGLENWRGSGVAGPDAVVIIRGGGAVNDLAWLNDYALARVICELPVPVLTGIGHERDSTILDEVANTRFDTPSKVAAGIEQVIKKRVQEAKDNFELMTSAAHRALNIARGQLENIHVTVRAGAVRHLALARQETVELVGSIRLEAIQTLHDASSQTRNLMTEVRHDTHQLLSIAKRDVPALFAEIRSEAHAAVKTARVLTTSKLEAVRDRTVLDIRRSHEAADESLRAIGQFAKRTLVDASANSTGLFREIAGQGPEKTLGRGFAIVRNAEGQPITSRALVLPGNPIEIQFRDGRVGALVTEH